MAAIISNPSARCVARSLGRLLRGRTDFAARHRRTGGRTPVADRQEQQGFSGHTGRERVAGCYCHLLITPKYEASARIEISRVDNNVTAVEGVETQDQVLDAQYYETQYELLQARSLAEQVMRDGELLGTPAFAEAFGLDPSVEGYENRVAERFWQTSASCPLAVQSGRYPVQKPRCRLVRADRQ